MADFTAVFPKVAYAVSFVENLRNPGNWVTNVVQKGRTVTWDSDTSRWPADYSKFDALQDALERAGYFGSEQSRKATVNGHKAPFVW